MQGRNRRLPGPKWVDEEPKGRSQAVLRKQNNVGSHLEWGWELRHLAIPRSSPDQRGVRRHSTSEAARAVAKLCPFQLSRKY